MWDSMTHKIGYTLWHPHEKTKIDKGRYNTKDQGQLTAVAWEDKREVYILSNMSQSSAEGKFQWWQESALKPPTVENYNKHTQYVDQSDGMASRYSMSQSTFKWMTLLFPTCWTL